MKVCPKCGFRDPPYWRNRGSWGDDEGFDTWKCIRLITVMTETKPYEFRCTNCQSWFIYGVKSFVPTVNGKEVCDECEKEMCGN